MTAFQFYLHSGKQQSRCFGQKFPDETASVRRCAVGMQQSILLTPKFVVKSSRVFPQSPQNVVAICGIDCLACRDEFFVNNLRDVKENDDHALNFAFHLSQIFCFSVSVSLDFPCAAHAFFPERLSNHCLGLRCTSSEFCTKFDAVPLSDPSRNRIRPDKWTSNRRK
jgi:hypothetical protein